MISLNLKPKKFDIVVSNGVAHHTSDNIKNIKLALKF